jgi:hypothetical protein
MTRVQRSLLLVFAVGVAVPCVSFQAWAIIPTIGHKEFCDATRAELKTLAEKRPPDVTPRQWDEVVFWTLNLHANCIMSNMRMPRAERAKFLAELRERLSGPVDLKTIDWIWDEVVRLSPGCGKTYSERHRPTTPERLREYR